MVQDGHLVLDRGATGEELRQSANEFGAASCLGGDCFRGERSEYLYEHLVIVEI
jgi:hypothetical protein